jgi:uncharacterized protein (DUF4415 family)
MPKEPLTDQNGDVRPLDAKAFAQMRWLDEDYPGIARAMKVARPVASFDLPLDAEVVAHFQAQAGEAWRERVNEALLRVVQRESAEV